MSTPRWSLLVAVASSIPPASPQTILAAQPHCSPPDAVEAIRPLNGVPAEPDKLAGPTFGTNGFVKTGCAYGSGVVGGVPGTPGGFVGGGGDAGSSEELALVLAAAGRLLPPPPHAPRDRQSTNNTQRHA